MKLSLEGYFQLPNQIRRELNEWMDREGLTPHRIVELAFHEGSVEVVCYSPDPLAEIRGELVSKRLPVRTPPPSSLLKWFMASNH